MLQRAWCEAGFSPESWWQSTPRQYANALRGAGDRLVREHNERIHASYWAARWQREKEMTPLRDVLVDRGREAAPERDQTPEEMASAFDALVLMTGGTLEEPAEKPERKRRRLRDSAK